jgi:hypothetical protein
MSEISKQALRVDNNTSFPDNNTGYISPSILRAFNVNMIDSLVEQEGYTEDSGSWNTQISALQAFSASQQPSFTSLNAFTASASSSIKQLNAFTQSANYSIGALNTQTASFHAYTASVNEIIVNGVGIGYSTRLFFNGYVSASIIPNVGGAIASITVLADQTFTPSASFNAYTASTNAWTASAKTEIAQLLQFSSSLDATYATDAQLNYSASVLQNNIDVNNAKFNDYTASMNLYTQSFSQSVANDFSESNSKINVLSSFTGSYATTGSNTFIGTQTIQNDGLFVLGQFPYVNLQSNAAGSGSQYPFMQLTLDTAAYPGDGAIGGYVIQDPSTNQSIGIGINTYTGVYGFPNATPVIYGQGASFPGDDTLIGFPAGRIDLWRTTNISGSLIVSGSSTLSGSTLINGNTTISGSTTITGSLTITGSAYGNVVSASITSNTASIDLSLGNFFTLALPNGVITNINITNPKPGETAILQITNTGIPSASFSNNVKQQRFNSYLPSSGSGTQDLLSIIAFSTSSVFVANSLNFV